MNLNALFASFDVALIDLDISWYHYIFLLEVYIKFSTSTQTFYTRTSANECNALSTSRINTLGSNVEDHRVWKNHQVRKYDCNNLITGISITV